MLNSTSQSHSQYTQAQKRTNWYFHDNKSKPKEMKSYYCSAWVMICGDPQMQCFNFTICVPDSSFSSSLPFLFSFLSFLFCFETVSLRCPAWIWVPGSGPFHLSLSSSWDPRYTLPCQLVSFTLSKEYFHLISHVFFGSLKSGNINKQTSVHRTMSIYLYQHNFLLKNPRTKTLFAYEIYTLQIERMVSSTGSCA